MITFITVSIGTGLSKFKSFNSLCLLQCLEKKQIANEDSVNQGHEVLRIIIRAIWVLFQIKCENEV